MTVIHTTREEWLVAAIHRLGRLFKDLGHDLPNVYVSVGFPGGGNKRTRIAECWNGIASADGSGHIFISPILDDAVQVLAALAHELIHSINHANGETGHGKVFADIAKPLGLVGKMTATVAGEELTVKLQAILTDIGDYPHAKLSLQENPKKQKTRMIKLECECCGYTVRTTQKWIDEGLPSCPRGNLLIQSEA